MFVQSNTFYKIGILIAASLAQGGSGLPFLHKGVYEYLCGIDLGLVTVEQTVIPDWDVQEIANKVSLRNKGTSYLVCWVWSCSILCYQ